MTNVVDELNRLESDFVHANDNDDKQNARRILLQRYRRFIDEQPHKAAEMEVENRMWKHVYTNIKSLIRRLQNSTKNTHRAMQIKLLLQPLLEDVTDFYTRLFDDCSKYAATQRLAAKTCYRSLICLGDLSRYQEQWLGYDDNDDESWKRAIHLYKLAVELDPHSGHAHNQLAVVEFKLGNFITTMYRYQRSLAVSSHPFILAQHNLQRFFKMFVARMTRRLKQIGYAAGSRNQPASLQSLLGMMGNDVSQFEDALVYACAVLYLNETELLASVEAALPCFVNMVKTLLLNALPDAALDKIYTISSTLLHLVISIIGIVDHTQQQQQHQQPQHQQQHQQQHHQSQHQHHHHQQPQHHHHQQPQHHHQQPHHHHHHQQHHHHHHHHHQDHTHTSNINISLCMILLFRLMGAICDACTLTHCSLLGIVRCFCDWLSLNPQVFSYHQITMKQYEHIHDDDDDDDDDDEYIQQQHIARHIFCTAFAALYSRVSGLPVGHRGSATLFVSEVIELRGCSFFKTCYAMCERETALCVSNLLCVNPLPILQPHSMSVKAGSCEELQVRVRCLVEWTHAHVTQSCDPMLVLNTLTKQCTAKPLRHYTINNNENNTKHHCVSLQQQQQYETQKKNKASFVDTTSPQESLHITSTHINEHSRLLSSLHHNSHPLISCKNTTDGFTRCIRAAKSTFASAIQKPQRVTAFHAQPINQTNMRRYNLTPRNMPLCVTHTQQQPQRKNSHHHHHHHQQHHSTSMAQYYPMQYYNDANGATVTQQSLALTPLQNLPTEIPFGNPSHTSYYVSR